MERPARRALLKGLAFSLLLVGLTLLSYGGGVFSDDLYVFPTTADDPAWWQRAIPVAIVLSAIAAAAYTAFFFALRRRALDPLWGVLGLLLAFRLGHEVGAAAARSDHVHCSNCSNHLRYALKRYAENDGEGRLPHGGRDEWDSLAKAVNESHLAGLVAHHALYPRTMEHWERTKTLSAEVCSYRYNEGLRVGDPPGLIVLSFKYPSDDLFSATRRGPLGRECLLLREFDGEIEWSFLTEAEFQEVQRRTEEFIRRRGQPQAEIEALKAELSVTLAADSPAPLRRRIRSRITNMGGANLGLTFLQGSGYRINSPERIAKGQLVHMRSEEVWLRPGESHEFPWGYEAEFEDGGGNVASVVRRKGGDHWVVERPGVRVIRGRESECFVEACVWALVRREGRPELELRMRSPRLCYVSPE